MPRMVNFADPRGGRLWTPPGLGGGGGLAEVRWLRYLDTNSTQTTSTGYDAAHARIVPREDITLHGMIDETHAAGLTMYGRVWEEGVTGAPIAEALATEENGEHVARFDSPVVLTSGVSYLIGWYTPGGVIEVLESVEQWPLIGTANEIWASGNSAYPVKQAWTGYGFRTDLLIGLEAPSGSDTLVAKSPAGGSLTGIGRFCLGEFTPDADTWLKGLRDPILSQNNCYALVYDGSTNALLRASAVIPNDGSLDGDFPAPILLKAGVMYKIGWRKGSDTIQATTATSAWAGFAVPKAVWDSVTGNRFSGYHPTFDLAIIT